MHDKVMTENGFKAKDIGLRAQKKILSRMASKNMAKVFIDDTTSCLLDNIYKLIKLQTNNKKDAERIVKNIIKIVIKIAVLNKNDQFDAEEKQLANKFYDKFLRLQMIITSFHEVDYSYDQAFILPKIKEIHQMLKDLVRRNLTDKSLMRIDEVFEFFQNPEFLDKLFTQNPSYRELMDKIVADMNKANEGLNI
ncbi:tumor necrosis factor alpha-induced protein 8-like protein [Culicoides brevitarsis]|uniref:tumor necrosis factor alpha-induced protein 8-like protein n=1 Tax=Culicoides brevitarsis TaxID=469753 RepID=UPI00307BD297